MGGAFKIKGSHLFGSAPARLLSCAWIAGFLLGLAVSYFFRNSISYLFTLSHALYSNAPLKLMLSILPFLLSVLTVSFSRPKWMFLICGMKAACFAVCCLLLYLCYGQAGWLACLLFLFSDICSLPILFLYWLQHISDTTCSLRKHFVFFLAMALIAFVDYGIVTPYAVKFLII